MLKSIFFIICTVVAVSYDAIAQSNSHVSENLQFNESSHVQEKTYTVANGTGELCVNLDGFLDNGNLEVTLFDPNGNKTNGFQLKTEWKKGRGRGASSSMGSGSSKGSGASAKEGKSKSTTTSVTTVTNSSQNSDDDGANKYNYSYSSKGVNSTAKGTMEEVIDDPMPGVWTLRIKTEDASGNLRYKVKCN